MVEMLALTEIWRGGTMIATGETDREGNPVIRREPEVVATGSRFTVEREEADELLRSGAAEEVGS